VAAADTTPASWTWLLRLTDDSEAVDDNDVDDDDII
jgi:hypothetical protein